MNANGHPPSLKKVPSEFTPKGTGRWRSSFSTGALTEGPLSEVSGCKERVSVGSELSFVLVEKALLAACSALIHMGMLACLAMGIRYLVLALV